MMWSFIEPVVKGLYTEIATEEVFLSDRDYLQAAFIGIEELWHAQFDQMAQVRYILFSEAPLWQNKSNYFYNPEVHLTQFLYKNDIAEPLGLDIADKRALLEVLQRIGFLVLDCSPLALAPDFTSITYQEMGKKKYDVVMKSMIEIFLREKMKSVLLKCDNQTVFLFRYKRVEAALKEHISWILEELGIVAPNYVNIGQKGGGIDRVVLKQVFQKQ